MANVINWFEIPASNLDRAASFYEKVLGGTCHRETMGELDMAFLPMQGEGVGGALVKGESYVPTASGSMVYLNGGDDLSEPLGRVEAAGGKVLLPKTKITDEIGYMGLFIDSEGNRVAFHSQN